MSEKTLFTDDQIREIAEISLIKIADAFGKAMKETDFDEEHRDYKEKDIVEEIKKWRLENETKNKYNQCQKK